MYLYARQFSAPQDRGERPAVTMCRSWHCYRGSAGDEEGCGSGRLADATSLIDSNHVVRMNRQFAESLGWKEHRNGIAKLLGLPSAANEIAFAEAVASWQRRKKIPRNGIIGPDTWFRMQLAMGILDPPFPRGSLDENHLTNLLFHSHHPERHMAPIGKGEDALKKEWKQIRDHLVGPMLRQSPLCEASGPDLERLADHLRSLSGEQKKKPPNAKRLQLLKNLLRLQVKAIIQSLDGYVRTGCTEPKLETLRLLVQALPWPKGNDVVADRAMLLNSILRAQRDALTSSDATQKQCNGSALIRIEVRKPRDFSRSFTIDPGQASLASAAIQIFVPKEATEVVQLEWLHARLDWVCRQAKGAAAKSGGEGTVHRILWTTARGQKGMCPLAVVGTERLACDGHTYGLAVKPGSTLRESAEKKGFDLEKCEWQFTQNFRATTSAYGGLNPLGRCTWGFQFSATQSIDKTGQMQRKASAKYWGADKELIIP
jgi:hypothetical protein